MKIGLLAAVMSIALTPAFAFDVRPDPDSTEGAVRIDGHDRAAACNHGKEHRGPMGADRRDEVLLRYGLQPGAQELSRTMLKQEKRRCPP